jgi:hypothetical protein
MEGVPSMTHWSDGIRENYENPDILQRLAYRQARKIIALEQENAALWAFVRACDEESGVASFGTYSRSWKNVEPQREALRQYEDNP